MGQGLLAAFAMGTLSDGKGHLLRELPSGVGFVDVGLILGNVLHLVELKVLRGGSFSGVSQLTQYMRTEQRRQGWLVVFDARTQDKQGPLPAKIDTADGTVRVLVININPAAPHKVRHRSRARRDICHRETKQCFWGALVKKDASVGNEEDSLSELLRDMFITILLLNRRNRRQRRDDCPCEQNSRHAIGKN